MTFSEYLNIIKVENAILLMHRSDHATMTSISLKCGFATVRNYNRVFKEVTGYSPRMLPKDFTINTDLRISKNHDFDPTHQSSILIQATDKPSAKESKRTEVAAEQYKKY